jgi:hypothetical protein
MHLYWRHSHVGLTQVCAERPLSRHPPKIYSDVEWVTCETGTGLKGKGQGGHTIRMWNMSGSALRAN